MKTSEQLTISSDELHQLVYGGKPPAESAKPLAVDLSGLEFSIEDRGPRGIVSSAINGPSPALMSATFTEGWRDLGLERLATDKDIITSYGGRHRRTASAILALSENPSDGGGFDIDRYPFGVNKDIDAIFSGLDQSFREVRRELYMPAAILTTLGGLLIIGSEIYSYFLGVKPFWQSAGQLLKSLNILS